MKRRRLAWLLPMLVGLRVAQAAAAIEVHPAGPTVPENLLRMELRFSQPQPLPFDVGQLALVDARGEPIERALLDLALPSADGRRIAVLLDPGRVKRGAGPNRMAGRALHAGEMVGLRMRMADGTSLVLKQWRIAPPESRALRPDSWQVQPPRAATRNALVIGLGRPISSSSEGLIAVLDARGRRVEGRIALGDDDATWQFMPDRPWRQQAYALVAHPALEDPAGNRRCAAFAQFRASEIRCDAPGAVVSFQPK